MTRYHNLLPAWIGLAFLVVSAANIHAAPKTIHSERSLYRNIIVTEDLSQRCLQFSVKKDQRSQSCINIKYPKKMVFTYTKMMLASLLINPEPERILIVGLGGGTLPIALSQLLPDSHITVVEIDQAVVEVAEQFFNFKASEQIQVVVQDARVFGKRALLKKLKYDLIMLDAYNGEYIPEHLLTQEYLQESHGLLSSKGVLAANTFSISSLYHHESETYRSVFKYLLNFKARTSANRILLASMRNLPALEEMQLIAQQLRPRLRAYDVPIHTYPKKLRADPDWDTSARVLTDQYAPANLLNSK